MKLPRLVAHRGYMNRFPENTLRSLQASITAGARFIEFDVQLTADRIPVLLHDETLDRTTGKHGKVTELSLQEIAKVSAHYPDRFGERFHPEPIATLSQAVELLNGTQGLTVFVEMKRQSLARFGVEDFTDKVVEALTQASSHCVLISFDQTAVRYARDTHKRPIGWVLREHDEKVRKDAQDMRPEFIFCNIDHLSDPGSDIWPGPWQWCTYDIQDPKLAIRLFQHGSGLIETSCIGEMMEALA